MPAALVNGTAGVDYATVVSASNTTSLTCAKPSGTVNGDLLVAFLFAQVGYSGVQDFSGPSGWTRMSAAPSVDGFQRPLGMWCLPVPSASALTATTFAFTAATSGRMGVLIVRVTGADLSAPLDVAGTWLSTGQTVTAAMPSVTTRFANSLVVALCHATGTAAQSFPVWAAAPSGFAQVASSPLNTSPPSGSASNDGLWVASKSQATAGATGVITETVSTQTSLTGTLVAIKSASAASLTATATDTASASDSASRGTLAKTRTTADSSTASDVASGPGGRARVATDSSTPSDAASRVTHRSLTAVDSSTPSDVAPRLLATARTATDSSSGSDTASRTSARPRTAVDSTTPTDTAIAAGRGQITASDATVPSDSATRALHLAGRSASDTGTPVDSAASTSARARTAIDATFGSDVATVLAVVSQFRHADDFNTPSDAAARVLAVVLTVTDTSAPSDDASAYVHPVGGSTAFGKPGATTTVVGSVGHSYPQQVGASTTVRSVLATTTVG